VTDSFTKLVAISLVYRIMVILFGSLLVPVPPLLCATTQPDRHGHCWPHRDGRPGDRFRPALSRCVGRRQRGQRRGHARESDDQLMQEEEALARLGGALAQIRERHQRYVTDRGA
jgi:hypothetical protein